MSVSLLLGLVYLISDSGLQKSNQESRNAGDKDVATPCGRCSRFSTLRVMDGAPAAAGRRRQAPTRRSRSRKRIGPWGRLISIKRSAVGDSVRRDLTLVLLYRVP